MLQGLADLLVFIIIIIIIIFNLSFWFAMIWVGFPFLFEEERGYDFGGQFAVIYCLQNGKEERERERERERYDLEV